MSCTKVMEADFLKVLSWHDNEWGFSSRCVDLLRQLIAKDCEPGLNDRRTARKTLRDAAPAAMRRIRLMCAR
jgi:hypothetical protein